MPNEATDALATAVAEITPVITEDAGVLAVLLAILAIIFWMSEHAVWKRLFKVVPAIVFCYFIPTTLTTFEILPHESALYDWVKAFVLPAALLLLILSLDLPAIIRLGPKAIIMMLAGTVGVVIGGPVAMWICRDWLPVDAWRGMAALSGSWIGGGANFAAIGEAAEVSAEMLALMVVPDVLIANIWMAVLLLAAGRQESIDRRRGADASAIEALKERMVAFQARVNRVASLPDLMMIIALAFVGSYVSYWVGARLPEIKTEAFGTLIGGSSWKYILVTTFGVALSFTKVRNLEGAGASKIGSVMIYLLVACIGASADFRKVMDAPGFVAAGVIWMAIHITVLLVVAKLIRAPLFFVAVGSQANIGGAASAPVVAAAFHPALAPVGALLAVAGYALGTLGGLLCMHLLKWAQGV